MKMSPQKLKRLINEAIRQAYDLNREISIEEAKRIVKILEQEKSGQFEPQNESDQELVVMIDKRKERNRIPTFHDVGPYVDLKDNRAENEDFVNFLNKMLIDIFEKFIEFINNINYHQIDPEHKQIFFQAFDNMKKMTPTELQNKIAGIYLSFFDVRREVERIFYNDENENLQLWLSLVFGMCLITQGIEQKDTSRKIHDIRRIINIANECNVDTLTVINKHTIKFSNLSSKNNDPLNSCIKSFLMLLEFKYDWNSTIESSFENDDFVY